MTHIEKIVLVPHKAKSMYDLVNDIESYPDFLPWCGGARVLQREVNEMVAEIDIKFKGFLNRSPREIGFGTNPRCSR